MIENDQERLGLESASSAYRRRRCGGSVNLIKALRQAGKLAQPAPDAEAASGTLVHQAWCYSSSEQSAILDTFKLSAFESETLHALQRLEKLVVADWAGNDEYTLLGREVRLWLHDGLEPVHSGQFDAAYGTIKTRRMLILDGKTLFSEVSPAEINDQLRELVALARFNYPGCQSFTVAILQPRVSERPNVAHYDQNEAELALRLLRLQMAESADPDAPRTAGVWCKHCPAQSQCEEARANIGVTTRLAERIKAGEFAIPLGEKGARVLDSIETAETTLKALKAAYKSLITLDPEAVPGWYLKEGNKVREIEDIGAAYQIAATYIGLDAFLSATKLSVGSLKAHIGEALNQSGKALDDMFNDTFERVITLKQNEPSLARVSPTKGRKKEVVTDQLANPKLL